MRISAIAVALIFALSAGAATAQVAPEHAGTYDVATPDGTTIRYVIHEDGTYVVIIKDETVENGTMTWVDDETCFTPAEKSEACYTVSAPMADGSFTSTPVDGGDTATIRRVAD